MNLVFRLALFLLILMQASLFCLGCSSSLSSTANASELSLCDDAKSHPTKDGQIIPLLVSKIQEKSRPWNGRIYLSGCSSLVPSEVPSDTFFEGATQYPTIILGEKHLTPEIQERQAWVIQKTIERDFFPLRPWHLAWEFLNRKDQVQTQGTFLRFVKGEISVAQFLLSTLGSGQYGSYAPILEVVKQLRGNMIGVNLSREEKAPVVQNGISALDPALLPPDFELGGEYYFERFKEAMGGHTSPEKLRNYFQAQSLTDDIMAYEMSRLPKNERKVLVTGSFHSDYFDGVAARLRKRIPDEQILLLRFIDASDYTALELESKLGEILSHPKYGPISEYVFFVKEPTLGPANF